MCYTLSKDIKKIFKKVLFQNLTEEEKEKKQEYVRKQCKNLTETKKQRLVEYRKSYYELRKNNCNVA